MVFSSATFQPEALDAAPSAGNTGRTGRFFQTRLKQRANECAEKEFIALLCVVSVKHLAAFMHHLTGFTPGKDAHETQRWPYS